MRTCALRELNKSRNNLVGNLVAILHPVVSILLAAPIVITKGTVDQQDGQIDDIKVRPDQTCVPGWEAPAETGQNFRNIVKMPRNLPPSVQEKKRLLNIALGGSVFGDNLVGNPRKGGICEMRLHCGQGGLVPARPFI